MNKNKKDELTKLIEQLATKEAESAQATGEATETDAQSQTDGDAMPKAKAEPTDKDAEFEKLIKGEFKEQFEKRIQNNLKRRFKESSSLKAKNDLNEKIVEMLTVKYGTSPDNGIELLEAIKNDDSYIKAEAEKSGIDTHILKRIKQLEYENEIMKSKMKKEREALAMEETIKSWMKDGEFLKENYPDFDLEAESRNPAFLKLLKGGADLKSAYLAMHHDEIVKALVEKAAQEAQTKTAESIRARASRPLENGMGNKSAALFKTDVSKLTPQQRAEIARRVANGEMISF